MRYAFCIALALLLSACANDLWSRDKDMCEMYHTCDSFCVLQTCSN